MTQSSGFATIANALTALSITGITLRDINNIPEACTLLCPVLYPKPDGFISGMEAVMPETFGTSGAQQVTIKYTLTYRYLHCPIGGALGGLFAVYDGLIDAWVKIADAVLNVGALSGATNIYLAGIPTIGPVADPAGNIYHGFDVAINIEQYAGGA
jgi:hypothetical protein